MKRCFSLIILVTAISLPAWAAPAVVGAVHVSGGFVVSSGPVSAPGISAACPTKISPTTGFPSGPAFATNNGGGHVIYVTPQCYPVGTYPYVAVSPGAVGSYTNYQVISGSNSPTYTSYSSGTVSAPSYYVAPATPQYVPITAPAPIAANLLPAITPDAKGYLHSPFSPSIFKVPDVANGQQVHDPVTGQVFRVQLAGEKQAVASASKID